LEPVSPDDPRWAALRAEFPPDELEHKPQPVGKAKQGEQRNMRGKCEPGRRDPDNWPISADEYFCGGYHARSVHLAYVGHAGLKMRLNDVVGPALWEWEPLALTPTGLPLFSDGGMWIRLTIMGYSKIGFGDAQGKNGPDAIKEIIGDALRNAAQQFGIATYLWGKSDRALLMREYEPPPAGAVDRRDEPTHPEGASHPGEGAYGPGDAVRTGVVQYQESDPRQPAAQPAEQSAQQQASDALAQARARHRAAIAKAHPDWDNTRKGDEIARMLAERNTAGGWPVDMNTATVEDWNYLTQFWNDSADAAALSQPQPEAVQG
jgi:hypothetical protein